MINCYSICVYILYYLILFSDTLDKIKTANTSNIFTVVYTLIMASLDY